MSTNTTVLNKTHRNWRNTGWFSIVTSVLLIGFGLAAVFWLLNLVIKGQCDQQCVTDTLAQMFRVATPIAFAAFCGMMCERAGIINIGIEGQMLMAAMVCYATNLFSFQWLKTFMDPDAAGSTSRIIALVLGLLSALLLAALHAVLSIRFKADQIISGTVINILALGLTGFFYRQFLAENLPAGPGTFPLVPIPGLVDIPVIGPIFFNQKPLTYILFIMVVFLYFLLFYTPWGLRTRAVGEHPRAADTLGVNVNWMRYSNTLIGGLMAGLGGAWFTLEAVDVFNPGMTNGLGFIGLAAMIFGKWKPIGALVGALIFGLGNSVTSTVSIFRPDIPSQIPQMLPYILTIIVLTGVVGQAIPPAAEGKVYEKQ